jgi:hypothetical protein
MLASLGIVALGLSICKGHYRQYNCPTKQHSKEPRDRPCGGNTRVHGHRSVRSEGRGSGGGTPTELRTDLIAGGSSRCFKPSAPLRLQTTNRH